MTNATHDVEMGEVEYSASRHSKPFVKPVMTAERHKCFAKMMPDWNNPTAERRNYQMVERFEDNKEDFLKNFFDANKSLEACYRHVFTRIIYQILNEFLERLQKKKDNWIKVDVLNKYKKAKELEKYEEFKTIFKKFLIKLLEETLKLENIENKQGLLQIIAVLWLSLFTQPAFIEFLHDKARNVFKDEPDMLTCLHLMMLLKNNNTADFHEQFESFLEDAKRVYGNYYKFAINHHVQLLSIVAKNLKRKASTNFILIKFPFIEINSSILTSFREVEPFTAIIIDPFESGTLEDLVSEA